MRNDSRAAIRQILVFGRGICHLVSPRLPLVVRYSTLSMLIFCGRAQAALGDLVKPSAPSGLYTNSVNFNFAGNVYRFIYTGSDGTLEYEYAPAADGSFHPLRCKVNGAYVLRPSNVGGLSLISGSTEIVPWKSGVTFQLVEAHSVSNALNTTWKMSYGTTNLTYTYQFQMTGRTLSVQVATTDRASGSLYLDRCEDAIAPVVVHVPCLSNMNVLLTGGVFASLFVDWESTAASTIYPLDSAFSSSSVYFAQQALYFPSTGGTRNRISETVYLTVSPSLSDVLPNVPNPVSPYKDLVSHYLVFDYWQTPFSLLQGHVQSLRSAGVSNVWVIAHVWQSGGFDNQYPDVLPAKSSYGGDAGLRSLSEAVRTNGYLFSLHENYVDLYTNAASWNPAAVARNGDGSLKLAWSNSSTRIQSYQMKPSLAAAYLATFAPQIHSNYTTTASFLDVHSAANPSDKVDYDAGVTNTAMFRETMSRYRMLAAQLRGYHQGPVSGEGNSHLFYTGYFDDIEAQLNSGSSGPRSQGSWLPLLVDFDLLKLHGKTMAHGVGYYERYFCDENGNSQFLSFPKEKVLAYMAAELAFGHGGFIPTQDRTYDYVAVANLEQRHVLPAQKLYAAAMPASILYRDAASNDLVTASDYIRRYPATFADATNAHFMGQVRVTYDNGVVVCVNRHPSQLWPVTLGHPGGNFNFNAVLNGSNTQAVVRTNLTSYVLPATNGWVVFAPDLSPPRISQVMIGDGFLSLGVAGLLPGCSNRVEQCFSLSSTNWQTVQSFRSDYAQTNWSQSVNGSDRQSFYRVVRFW